MPPESSSISYPSVPHYYGDYARKLFLGGAIVMLLSLPLERDILPTAFIAVTTAALLLTFLAGFTSPKKRLIIVVDTLVAALMFVIFEYAAVNNLSHGGDIWSFTFIAQEILALNFLIALYFCSKTWREMPPRKRS